MLEILEIYGRVTVQGRPMPGRRGFGVPPGGAFDLESFSLANALLGNAWDVTCLELSMAHLRLRTNARMTIGWAGACASQSALRLAEREEILLAAPHAGCRSYIGLTGGVREANLIRGGKITACEVRDAPARKLDAPPDSLTARALRILPGPQSGRLPFERLVGGQFQTSRDLDRVGIRLEPDSALCHELSLPSEPSTAGAVQITPSGHAIILGPDGPTIGGYPKIGMVIRADLARVGQIRPGDPVSFEEVSIEEAREIDRQFELGLRKKVKLLELSR